MKTRLFSCLLIALVSVCNSMATPKLANPEFIAAFNEANKLMEEKFWVKAVQEWREVLAMDPGNMNVNYKLGYCLLQTETEKTQALKYLEIASMARFNSGYDAYDPREKNAPLETLYYLAIAQHLNLQFDKSTESLLKLKETASKNHKLVSAIDYALATNVEAKKQMESPREYKIKNLGTTVNSKFADFSPVVTFNENSMFFTSRRLRPDSTNANIKDFVTDKYRDDIYVVFKNKNGDWVIPELLNLNSDDHDATISVSPDGNTLFIYKDSLGDGQVMSSALIGETWSTPAKLGSDINSKYWETHCTISANGTELYFVSDRPKGEGGRDIYKCVKGESGVWGISQNIGSNVNTEYDEDAPFLSADGKYLYFASKGHNSMGGFDLFVCERDANGNWMAPVNMGYPLNTVDDDIFFQPSSDGKRAFYSSRKDGGQGDLDIYEVELPSVEREQLAALKGLFKSSKNSTLPSGLKVKVSNARTNEIQSVDASSENGSFFVVLKPCATYHVDYSNQNENIKSEDLNIPCDGELHEYVREIVIFEKEPVVVKDPVKTEFDPKDPVQAKIDETATYAEYSHYFLYGKSEFSSSEVEFMDFVLNCQKVIDQKSFVTIAIEGSASNVPNKGKSNDELSKERSENMKISLTNALVKNGYIENVDFKYAEPINTVQGKKYENDAMTNRVEYEKYQYIKVKVQ